MEKIIFVLLGVVMVSVVMDIFLDYIHSKLFWNLNEKVRNIQKIQKISRSISFFICYIRLEFINFIIGVINHMK